MHSVNPAISSPRRRALLALSNSWFIAFSHTNLLTGLHYGSMSLRMAAAALVLAIGSNGDKNDKADKSKNDERDLAIGGPTGADEQMTAH
jgi:hypothetical protein